MKLTPAMQQYLEMKELNKDALLFFRMGDFYELFFEDAVLASRILGIALTSRDKEKKIPMCGMPFHSADAYIAKLIKEGYKVAVCEQTEDASLAKGLVRREVVRVCTPGTVTEDSYLNGDGNNFIGALSWNSNQRTAGLAYMDLTTGEFNLTEFDGADALFEETRRLALSEILISQETTSDVNAAAELAPKLGVSKRAITELEPYDFKLDTAKDRLLRHFELTSLDGLGCEGMSEGLKAAGALLHYVKHTQRGELPHLKSPRPYHTTGFMVIDSATERSLEIMQSSRTLQKDGSLLKVLDKSSTPMGGRLLKQWLSKPLINVDEITERHDAVAEFLDKAEKRELLRELLSGIYDMERLIGRVSVGNINPRDLVALKDSLLKIPEIKKELKGFSSLPLKNAGESLDAIPELSSFIESSIKDTPPVITREGGFINDGYSAELDELRSICSGGKDWIASLEKSERQRTGISKLKVGYNKVFGYFIEVSKLNSKSVPFDYTRKQTLTNAERYITPELKEAEGKILGAVDRSKELELTLFSEIKAKVSTYIVQVQATAARIASLDVLSTFADVSEAREYTRPLMDGSRRISITEGRHPVIESSKPEEFVPNDLSIDSENEQIHILTGPNMAGKSTYIRQLALQVIMAQAGCFVPAKSAEIGVVDRLFSRVGASDDISRGQSTFMVEMNETANILNNATPRSLIILDEIGRGTSTFDGLSIAWSVVEYLHDNQELCPRTLFATHYHELTELSLTKERVSNYNMSVKEWEGDIHFLRKVVPGGTNRSYGIHVARLAGLPKDVIERAKEILKNLESGELTEDGLPKLARAKNNNKDSMDTQPFLKNLLASSDKDKAVEDLKKTLETLDTDNITPIEAINELNKLKRLLKD